MTNEITEIEDVVGCLGVVGLMCIALAIWVGSSLLFGGGVGALVLLLTMGIFFFGLSILGARKLSKLKKEKSDAQ